MIENLSDRLRGHVNSRLCGPHDGIENRAWGMMLDAAGRIEELESITRRSADEGPNSVEYLVAKEMFKGRLLRLAARLSKKNCSIYHSDNLFNKCTEICQDLLREEDHPSFRLGTWEPLYGYRSKRGRNDPRWEMQWVFLGLDQEQFEYLFEDDSYGDLNRGFRHPRTELNLFALIRQAEAVFRILNFIMDNGEKSAE